MTPAPRREYPRTMPVTSNAAAVKIELAALSGSLLLRLAVTVQTGMMTRLGVHNPPPYANSSKQGEYLRSRTTWLLKHVQYEPTTAAAAAREGRIRVGYGASAAYGAMYDSAGKRKGLRDAVEEMRGTLQAMAAKG